jgi:hypothetical protein
MPGQIRIVTETQTSFQGPSQVPTLVASCARNGSGSSLRSMVQSSLPGVAATRHLHSLLRYDSCISSQHGSPYRLKPLSERIQLLYAKSSAGSQSAFTQQVVVCVREELDSSGISTKLIGLKLAVMARKSVKQRAIIMNAARGDILFT